MEKEDRVGNKNIVIIHERLIKQSRRTSNVTDPIHLVTLFVTPRTSFPARGTPHYFCYNYFFFIIIIIVHTNVTHQHTPYTLGTHIKYNISCLNVCVYIVVRVTVLVYAYIYRDRGIYWERRAECKFKLPPRVTPNPTISVEIYFHPDVIMPIDL